jgi:hypothetical protein
MITTPSRAGICMRLVLRGRYVVRIDRAEVQTSSVSPGCYTGSPKFSDRADTPSITSAVLWILWMQSWVVGLRFPLIGITLSSAATATLFSRSLPSAAVIETFAMSDPASPRRARSRLSVVHRKLLRRQKQSALNPPSPHCPRKRR